MLSVSDGLDHLLHLEDDFQNIWNVYITVLGVFLGFLYYIVGRPYHAFAYSVLAISFVAFAVLNWYGLDRIREQRLALIAILAPSDLRISLDRLWPKSGAAKLSDYLTASAPPTFFELLAVHAVFDTLILAVFVVAPIFFSPHRRSRSS